MTIHKSKGLEFPVVIIPFADEDYEKKPKDKIWIETNIEEFGISNALVNNTKSVENFGVEAHSIYSEIKQQDLLDNINVIYVALTRAEEQLYIISNYIDVKKDGNYPYNMASFFIKYLKERNVYEDKKFHYEFGVCEKVSEEKGSTSSIKVLTPVAKRFDKNKIRIAQKESLLWGTHQQNAIEYGNIIHEILSKVLTRNDVKFAVADALEIGAITANQKDAFYKVIIGIVDNEFLRAYFSDGNKVLNEQVIIQKDQKTAKPDRIVITPKNEILLLDYKTGRPAEEHIVQLENYQNILEKMNYKVIAKTLVYIGEKIELIQL